MSDSKVGNCGNLVGLLREIASNRDADEKVKMLFGGAADRITELEAENVRLTAESAKWRDLSDDWQARAGAAEAEVERLKINSAAVSKAADNWEKHGRNLEAKLAAIEGLQRYAVNQKIGQAGECPLYADQTGSWVAVGNIDAILRGEPEDSNA